MEFTDRSEAVHHSRIYVTERRFLRENKEARIFLFRMKRKNG